MGTKDILLVDDCLDQLHLLSVILESQGFDVTTAASGCKALELLNNNKYRIVITNFNMEISGIELAALVRIRHSDTRVVLITADAFPGIIEKAVSAGICEMFSKPIDMRRLVATIRFSLQIHSSCACSG